ncbi:MAG: DegT/DnrJ/EryC1/StrS family aminotransferase [Candidatus Hodarchaeota archaeon]
MIYISRRPTFSLTHILRKNKRRSSLFPLNHKRCYFFFNARYALLAAINALRLKSDDAILLPSYNCGVEIDPILHLGIKPLFYNVTKNFLPDFDDLLDKITKQVKAILVTHFLGFPQPIEQIKEICVRNEIFLIEDCAHAFLSKNNGVYLGSYGDASIFSLLKTLPIPNGGALVIINKDIEYRHNSQKPSFFATLFSAVEILNSRSSINDNLFKEIVKRIINNSVNKFKFCLIILKKISHKEGLYLVRSDSYTFNEKIISWGISQLSKNILGNLNFNKIKKIRRRNFKYLLNHFLKNKKEILIFEDLPNGVCPLFFPIFVKNSETREVLYRTLKLRGIVTHPWWNRFHPEVPWEAFPDAVYLKQRLLGLPIHQDLELKHLDEVIREFENVYQSLER